MVLFRVFWSEDDDRTETESTEHQLLCSSLDIAWREKKKLEKKWIHPDIEEVEVIEE